MGVYQQDVGVKSNQACLNIELDGELDQKFFISNVKFYFLIFIGSLFSFFVIICEFNNKRMIFFFIVLSIEFIRGDEIFIRGFFVYLVSEFIFLGFIEEDFRVFIFFVFF